MANVRHQVHNKLAITALKEVGESEVSGIDFNHRIIEYFRAVEFSPTARGDETPWCSAFVNFILQKNKIKGTRLALARSFMSWYNSISPTGHEGPPSATQIKDAPVGAVIVLKRGKDPMYGHVGFFINLIGDQVFVLGGNQNNSVCIKPYKLSDVLDVRVIKGSVT